SALTGQNIQETFDFLAYKLLLANNIQDVDPPIEKDGIIDVKEAMGTKQITETPGSMEAVSRDEFDELVKKVEMLEDKLNTVQTILKQIVKKLK
ncbi:MAG: hypothetical protein KAJ72_07355, partial [Candidatus Heimdallarchaeota archaeon]|nr:hypothetical protein [Candidatus Heimdallarchaeota archaeon]